LAAFIDEPVKHYYQGIRVRLGFIIATTIRPDILIIDETLSGGELAF
jgi:ABC-type polysaccharide/polyol phosphate transport system ATPase subunit